MSPVNIILFILFILVLILLCQNKQPMLIQGGTRIKKKILGPRSYTYYSNIFGKKLYLFGEHHIPIDKKIKGIDVVDFFKEKIKNKNTVIFLETHYSPPKCHWAEYPVGGTLDRINKINSNQIKRVNSRYETKEICYLYSMRVYGGLYYRNGTIKPNKELEYAYKWTVRFIKKHKTVNSVAKNIFNKAQIGPSFKYEYNKLSITNQKHIYDIIKESIDSLTPNISMNKDYIKLRNQPLNKENILKLYGIFECIITRIYDLVTLMRIFNSKYKIIYTYFGTKHTKQIRNILSEYWNINPTTEYEAKKGEEFIILNNIAKN